MLSLIKWVIKSAIFAIVVLIAANYFRFGGKTISDQVKTQLAHAEQADLTSKMKNWAGSITNDARKGATRKQGGGIRPSLSEGRVPNATIVAPSGSGQSQDHLDDSERQKLRALIRELNTAPGEN